jgi:hypothetical protein
MKIGIDASRYTINEPTGVEWYCHHLLNALIPILGRDHHLDVTLYAQKKLALQEVFLVKKWLGDITPLNEVEEVQWITTHDVKKIKVGSIIAHKIMPELKKKGLIK